MTEQPTTSEPAAGRFTPPPGVAIDSVLSTAELSRRPSRPRNDEVENRALLMLVQHLADSPSTIIQRLAEITLLVFAAGSAGVSLVSKDNGDFYWPAIAGAWEPHIGGGTPRNFGPCGIVLDTNACQLFRHPERFYPYLAAASPVIEEVLLAPFYVRGQAVGTVWVVSHDPSRVFDSEDQRLLTSIATFASGAFQANDILEVLARERESLRESEARFRLMANAVPVLIWVSDVTKACTWFNQWWLDFSGRSMEQLVGDGWAADVHPDDLERCLHIYNTNFDARRPFEMEYRLKRRDGEYRWVLDNGVPQFDAEGVFAGYIGSCVDFTERKRAEAANAFLGTVVEFSDDAIITKNLDSVITSWNASAERLFGYTAEEAIGQSVTMLIPPDRLDEEPRIIEQLKRGERVDHFETNRRRKDGTLVDISLTISPVKDAQGHVIGASKIARDITERKRANEMLQRALSQRTEEVKRAERTLATSERMAAVGTLASGLAHDMSNLLLPLGVRLEPLLTKKHADPETHDELVVISALLDHLRVLGKNLSLFSRDPEKEGIIGRTNVDQWVGSVHKLLDASVGREIAIKWDCPAFPNNLPEAAVSPHRLTQAVQNLIHNARDAVLAAKAKDRQRIPRITVECRQRDASTIAIRVIDNGIGMDEQTKSRAIEPFFTTRDRPNEPGGSGSGLGLSLAHQIAHRAGGSMEIDSEIDKGTTITLILPIASAADSRA